MPGIWDYQQVPFSAYQAVPVGLIPAFCGNVWLMMWLSESGILDYNGASLAMCQCPVSDMCLSCGGIVDPEMVSKYVKMYFSFRLRLLISSYATKGYLN